jgi:hypothetical protein
VRSQSCRGPAVAGRLLGCHAVWSAWLLTRCLFVALLLVVHKRHPATFPNDVASVYYAAARAMADGRVPYVGFHYEYPPTTLPFVAAARLFGGASVSGFVVSWIGLMIALDALVLAVLHSWVRPARWAGPLWVAGVAAFGPTAWLRNDLIVVAAFVLACRFAFTGRPVASGIAWAFGFLAKLWPAPLLAALSVGRREGRWRMLVAAAASTTAVFGTLAVGGALGAMGSTLLDYQGHRPIEIESVWANAAWLHALVDGHSLRVVFSFGSYNLASARALRISQVAQLLTWCVQVGCVALPLALRLFTGRVLSAGTFAWTCGLYVTATLIVDPVLSAQYLLWVLAAAAVVTVLDDGVNARCVAVLSVVVCGLSVVVYPILFDQLRTGGALAIVVLTLRNTVLLVIGVCSVIGLRQSLSPARDPRMPPTLSVLRGQA